MRVAVLAIDTRGGVQPYLALSLGLRRAGHEVRVVAPEGFAGLVATTGLDFRPLSGDVEAVVRQAARVTERGALQSIRFTHHGGAGTTGAGFRAGVPALVVPFTMDQPFWGARVHALGAGPRPIPRKKLDVDALAAGLRELATNEAMRARAAELGALVRAEDGVATAVAHFAALR